MILSADEENLQRAADLIRRGELVAFPTETVYGLGARADDGTALAKIFSAKQRPSFDPLIVHLESPDDVSGLVTVYPALARRLADRFWPGPLTLVLPKATSVPDIVTAGLPAVAVRIPAHPVALRLLRLAGVAIAAPSANRFGCVSPTTAQHVDEQLGEHVSLILDGGPCRVGLESTIVSFTEREPALLRPGGVSLEEIEAEIGPVMIAAAGARPLAPGQLPRHYAPRTTVQVVAALTDIPADRRRGTALLLIALPQDEWDEGDEWDEFAQVERLSGGDLNVAAARLFAALRELDRGGFSRIWCLAIEERGLGRAIMDRLRRAAHPA